MQQIAFEYNGNKYDGFLLKDVAAETQYYWVLVNDEEISGIVGDSVAFHLQNGRLEVVYPQASQEAFIEQLRKRVESVVLPTN